MLTESKVKKAKAGDKRYMLNDGNNLYLEVMPGGNKYWRLRYWVAGKEKKRSLGPYPEITLKEARELRNQAKRSLVHTGRPCTEGVATFRDVALEWYEKRIEGVRSEGHVKTVSSRLKRYLLPFIGDRPISEVSSLEILDVLREIENQNKFEMAHRVRQICGQVFRYGVATGRCAWDPTAALRGALTPVRVKHHASLTRREDIAGLMKAVHGMDSLLVKNAMLFQAYTFVRPGELRKAEWSELDLEKNEWRIPPERMKMKRPHIVPLSDQSMAVIETVRLISMGSRYLFPSIRTKDRPMSENTLLAALRRLGYTKEEMTPHGFRSMASTVLNEHEWPRDAIERQLAHVEGNSVRSAYNYAQYLDTRREMMQWYADWLEGLLLENFKKKINPPYK